MNNLPRTTSGSSAARAIALLGVFAAFLNPMTAAGLVKAPVSKLYVVANQGDSKVTAEGKIFVPTPKDSFYAQGSQIGTQTKGSLTLVFSNGTGALLGANTSIEVKRFSQDMFTASRTGLEREPSVSHLEVFVAQGTLAVSSSKPAVGSSMIFLTSLGSLNLRDGNLVVQSNGTSVKYSLLEGEAMVYGGSFDSSGQAVHGGEQAVILPGPPGQPNNVRISKILPEELQELAALSAPAYAARKTVLFAMDAGEITPVQVVPESLPVEAAISPSKLSN